VFQYNADNFFHAYRAEVTRTGMETTFLRTPYPQKKDIFWKVESSNSHPIHRIKPAKKKHHACVSNTTKTNQSSLVQKEEKQDDNRLLIYNVQA